MKISWLWLLLTLFSSIGSSAGHAPDEDLSGDQRIVAAREAARKGDQAHLQRLVAQSGTHLLDGYVRYWQLANLLARSETIPSAALHAFLRTEPATPLGERLRSDWLQRLARDGDWDEFMRLYPGLLRPGLEIRCTHWTAQLMRGNSEILDEVVQGWRELDQAPAACDTPLQAALGSGRLDSEELWQRARRQVDSRQPRNALLSWSWLPASAAPDPTQADQALRAPAAWLDRLPPNFAIQRSERELVLAALTRLARENAMSAFARLPALQDRFSQEERAHLQAVIAMHAAIDHMPAALKLYQATRISALTPLQRAWRVRAALRAGDWKEVQRVIGAMPAAESAQPEWIYWLGRALVATGQQEAGAALFARIRNETHYYGLLAAEELGELFQPPRAEEMLAADKLAAAAQDPGIRRALALFRLNLRNEAVREWIWALRERDEEFRLAAAHIALRHELYDRAINTAELSNPDANYMLRFLTPYRDLIEPEARKQDLDLSWIYGLMRQESRFAAPARSSAGAQGLMQVMPATGKWVANKIGLRSYRPAQLSDPGTNVLLGTSYMRIIFDDLDRQPVLASAAYNAGPGRARRWRDDKTLEGAIYTETIPFHETRDYVKKVMANATVYAAMLEGRPQSLKARLGVVGPRPSPD